MKKEIIAALICISLSACETTGTNWNSTQAGLILLQGIENTSRQNAIMYNQMYWQQQNQLNQTIETNRIMHQNQWNNDVNRWNNGFNR